MGSLHFRPMRLRVLNHCRPTPARGARLLKSLSRLTSTASFTRRRSNDSHAESWLIFHGDEHVGTIARSVGNPNPPRNGKGAAASIGAAILASARLEQAQEGPLVTAGKLKASQ